MCVWNAIYKCSSLVHTQIYNYNCIFYVLELLCTGKVTHILVVNSTTHHSQPKTVINRRGSKHLNFLWCRINWEKYVRN